MLDLGSSCIKAAVCELRPGQAAILGVGREPLGERAPLTARGEYAMAPELLSSLCDVALRRAEDMTTALSGQKTVPDNLIIGVPGDVLCSFSTTVQAKRARPEARITEEELTSLLQRSHRLSARQLLDHPRAAEQYGRGGWALTNAMVTEVMVDDVRVVDPLRFQGRTVQVTVANVFAPDAYQQLLAALAAELDLQLMRLVAEPFALACSIPTGESIFLDVGGDRTDVAVVRGGAVTAISSLSMGSRTLTRQIASRLGIPFERAEEAKLKRGLPEVREETAPERTATQPALPPLSDVVPAREAAPKPPVRPAVRPQAAVPAEAVAEIAREFAAAWLDGLEIVLASVADHEPLPTRIVLAGGGSQLPELAAGLVSPAWLKRLPFAGIPNVGFLPPREVRGAVDRTQRLLGPQDAPMLALARLAAVADHPETLQDKLLKKVIGEHTVPLKR